MAHYLKFNATVTCKVNGVSVSSGYELHDGDVIVATADSTGNSYFYVNFDKTNPLLYSDGDTVDVYDNDIVVSSFNPTASDN